MNEKINIQDFVELLAEKHGMSKKNADSFVKEFFQLIEEALEKDKYVKVKGLGTFKLIDVENRESVNINTGERFEIQGYTKVSFTPESTLKGVINRPFSHFETVPLNDDTVLEDTLLDSDNEEDEEAEAEKNTEAKIEEVEKVKKAEIETKVEESLLEPIAKENGDSSAMKYFIGIVVFVVILCSSAIAYLYNPNLLEGFTSKPMAEKSAYAEVADSTIIEKDSISIAHVDKVTDTSIDSLKMENELEKEVEPVREKQSASNARVSKEKDKAVSVPFKPDSVGYTITGTKTTYTIREGETLTRVALRFYGTKTLWPYLVKHNPDVIKNPDNVPFGTTIKIPKLVKKQ